MDRKSTMLNNEDAKNVINAPNISQNNLFNKKIPRVSLLLASLLISILVSVHARNLQNNWNEKHGFPNESIVEAIQTGPVFLNALLLSTFFQYDINTPIALAWLIYFIISLAAIFIKSSRVFWVLYVILWTSQLDFVRSNPKFLAYTSNLIVRT